MGSRLSRDVVLYFLKNKASDLADKINLLLEERRKDLRIWAGDPMARQALTHAADPLLNAELERQLNLFCREKEVYDLLLVATNEGKILCTNTVDRYGTYLSPENLQFIRRQPLEGFSWFVDSKAGKFSQVDWHVSPLLHSETEYFSTDSKNFGVGFSAPIRASNDGPVLGVWYAVMNWSAIQVDVLDQVKKYFQTLQTPESYKSGYAWLWAADANRIIGHENRNLYGREVSGRPVFLPQLKAAALRERWGVFPEYEWPPGTPKNAAFRWTRTPSEGGFGWIVGLGINNEDILATVTELRQVLFVATILILAGILIWTWILSQTIAGPVKKLTAITNEIARGNLEIRVPVETHDEIGLLASSFNHMAEDLAASREKLVKAEKEAAWREMARQVAHEIKNPLTPMQLSVELLQKARADQSGEFPKIFEQTTATILRQIDSLRRIASDFSAFAGVPRRNPKKIAVLELLKECLALYTGWIHQKQATIEQEGEDGEVFADREELRRLLINLLDNALEALPQGGKIRIESKQEKGFLELQIADGGPGIPAEIRERLFEPYFSTKTTGTGLGLAICHRIVSELGGTIHIDSEAGKGTTVRVGLPLSTQ